MTRLDEYLMSERVTLRPGDHIRLKDGPYYQRLDGSLRRYGYRGDAIIESIEETTAGVVLTCTGISRSHGCRWESVTARITGATTEGLVAGMMRRPYTVTKCRARLDVQPFPIHIPARRKN